MKHILTFAALVFATSCFGQEACPAPIDVNSNGAVDIADFLNVLGLFGDVDSDGDGVWDSQDLCTDFEACNFMDGSASFCAYPDAIGDCNGDCPEDMDGDGVCDVYSCGDPVSYQGYNYTTVQIGNQCWFAENLRSENYENGDTISAGLSNVEWANTSTGAVAVYDDNASNFVTYGHLYNWFAVDDARGLCPSGWHVPSVGEWTVMTDLLGGDSVAGSEMKTTYGWSGGFNGTNSSGFSGLPGGLCDWANGGFYYLGLQGIWWSSSPEESAAWSAGLHAYFENITPSFSHRGFGFSVRCIQDSE